MLVRTAEIFGYWAISSLVGFLERMFLPLFSNLTLAPEKLILLRFPPKIADDVVFFMVISLPDSAVSTALLRNSMDVPSKRTVPFKIKVQLFHVKMRPVFLKVQSSMVSGLLRS